jgi:hypothetical protein
MQFVVLPFEAPKLSAVAMTSMDQNAFAAQLDRAIARSSAARVLPPPTIIDAEPLRTSDRVGFSRLETMTYPATPIS